MVNEASEPLRNPLVRIALYILLGVAVGMLVTSIYLVVRFNGITAWQIHKILWRPVMYMTLPGSISLIAYAALMERIKHEVRQTNRLPIFKLAYAVMLVALSIGFGIMFAQIDIEKNYPYLAAVMVEPNIEIENATLYVAPAESGVNVTLVLSIRNNADFPVNITGVYADIGECGIKHCLSKLDLPETATVPPHSVVTIVASRLHYKAVNVTDQTQLALMVTRGDIAPYNADPVEHLYTAWATVEQTIG